MSHNLKRKLSENILKFLDYFSALATVTLLGLLIGYIFY